MNKKIKIINQKKPTGKVTSIVFSDRRDTRFLEKDGVLTLQIGIGDKKNIERRKLLRAIRKIVRTAKNHHLEKLSVDFSILKFPKLKELQVNQYEKIQLVI